MRHIHALGSGQPTFVTAETSSYIPPEKGQYNDRFWGCLPMIATCPGRLSVWRSQRGSNGKEMVATHWNMRMGYAPGTPLLNNGTQVWRDDLRSILYHRKAIFFKEKVGTETIAWLTWKKAIAGRMN